MVKYEARVVLANEVYEKMMWLTRNFDKEIGAMGTVKIRQEQGDKYFYVDKLFFPKQKVTSATVHFDGSMWGDLLKEMTPDDMGRIAFYWHRHPGSASHSCTDEDDTFEAFMSKEANRKYFIFAQTAEKANGEIDAEWRVDIRHPVRCSITGDNVAWEWELSPEQEALEKALADKEEKLKVECEEMIERCVIKEAPKTWYGYTPPSNTVQSKVVDWSNGAVDPMLGNVVLHRKGHETYDNDALNGVATCFDEKAGIEFKSGAVHCLAGPLWKQVLQTALNKDGRLHKFVRSFRWTETEDGKLDRLMIQPNKGQYEDLCEASKNLFLLFNKAVVNRWEKEEQIVEPADYEVFSLEGDELICCLLEELSENYWFDFGNPNYGYAFDLETGNPAGTVIMSNECDVAEFSGEVAYEAKLLAPYVEQGLHTEEKTLEAAVADDTDASEEEL